MYISQISKKAADAGEMWYYLYYTALKQPRAAQKLSIR